jgi:hypothetical protein
MKQTFEDYCRQLKVEADALSRQADSHARFNHLQAFDFGRSVGRIENAYDDFWLRVRWLLLGAAVGVTLAAVYLQIFFSVRFLK